MSKDYGRDYLRHFTVRCSQEKKKATTKKQKNKTKKRFGVLEYQRAFRFTSLNNKRATILDRITPIPTPPPPPPPSPPHQIKDEAARRAKTCHFSIFDMGGGGLGFPLISSKIVPFPYMCFLPYKMHHFCSQKEGSCLENVLVCSRQKGAGGLLQRPSNSEKVMFSSRE